MPVSSHPRVCTRPGAKVSVLRTELKLPSLEKNKNMLPGPSVALPQFPRSPSKWMSCFERKMSNRDEEGKV